MIFSVILLHLMMLLTINISPHPDISMLLWLWQYLLLATVVLQWDTITADFFGKCLMDFCMCKNMYTWSGVERMFSSESCMLYKSMDIMAKWELVKEHCTLSLESQALWISYPAT